MRARTAAPAAILAVILLGQAAPIVQAQPASTAPGTPRAPSELDRAKDLYVAAEQAMADGKFGDALRDYDAVHAITLDPVLYFKLGKANEGIGRCDVAIEQYRRYLREASPTPEYVEIATARIVACGGDPADPVLEPTPPPTPPSTLTDAATQPPIEPVATTPPSTTVAPIARHRGPWLMIGGSIALLTIGGVLAYSANAAEADLRDLYVSVDGNPPVFDAGTKVQYDDLVDQGRRYEHLSWVAFGLGGATAIAAGTWYFFQHRHATAESKTAVHLAPTTTGFAAFGRF